ncbi:MAG TPA: hypothetical protein VFZ25_20270 [Chloroflexota bacterium]|nr:hypothetical protein [Chloroflexota bacterium]
MNYGISSATTRRRLLRALYVVVWLGGSVAIGIPIIRALGGVLDLLDPGVRLLFYAMPPLLVGMLVLGVLQIIAMYRYWYGNPSPEKKP